MNTFALIALVFGASVVLYAVGSMAFESVRLLGRKYRNK